MSERACRCQVPELCHEDGRARALGAGRGSARRPRRGGSGGVGRSSRSAKRLSHRRPGPPPRTAHCGGRPTSHAAEVASHARNRRGAPARGKSAPQRVKRQGRKRPCGTEAPVLNRLLGPELLAHLTSALCCFGRAARRCPADRSVRRVGPFVDRDHGRRLRPRSVRIAASGDGRTRCGS